MNIVWEGRRERSRLLFILLIPAFIQLTASPVLLAKVLGTHSDSNNRQSHTSNHFTLRVFCGTRMSCSLALSPQSPNETDPSLTHLGDGAQSCYLIVTIIVLLPILPNVIILHMTFYFRNTKITLD
jgi:hypothetical protein